MKQITIKISGNCDVFTIVSPKVKLTNKEVENYYWIPDMVDKDLVDGSIFYELPFMMHINEVVWYEDDDNEHKIIKKGKYIKKKIMFQKYYQRLHLFGNIVIVLIVNLNIFLS